MGDQSHFLVASKLHQLTLIYHHAAQSLTDVLAANNDTLSSLTSLISADPALLEALVEHPISPSSPQATMLSLPSSTRPLALLLAPTQHLPSPTPRNSSQPCCQTAPTQTSRAAKLSKLDLEARLCLSSLACCQRRTSL